MSVGDELKPINCCTIMSAYSIIHTTILTINIEIFGLILATQCHTARLKILSQVQLFHASNYRGLCVIAF